MYKEVLDYIRDLGKERALPEKDRQKERQEEVCECMNMIADEICRIYGSYGFTCFHIHFYISFNRNEDIAT